MAKLYPQSGEGSIVRAPKRGPATRAADWKLEDAGASFPVVSNGVRARGRIRRYARANRMRYLWTLTYADEPGTRKDVVAQLRLFFDQLHQKFGKQPLVAVIERGGENGRLHVHFAAARFLRIKVIRKCWGRGHVWVGDPGKYPARSPVRRLASYLAKYISKDVEDVLDEHPKHRAKGEHRYLLTQGYQPTAWSLRFARPETCAKWLLALYGECDLAIVWGDWDDDPVYGIWLSFPDRLLHDPPRVT